MIPHKAGPGCITYEQMISILGISSKMMVDYLEQQNEQTKTAIFCSNQASDCIVEMANKEREKAQKDAWFKIGGSLAGIATSVGSLGFSLHNTPKINAINRKLEKISKTENALSQKMDAITKTKASGAGQTPAQPQQQQPAFPAGHQGAITEQVAQPPQPGAAAEPANAGAQTPRDQLLTDEQTQVTRHLSSDEYLASEKMDVETPAGVKLHEDEFGLLGEDNIMQAKRNLKTRREELEHEKEALKNRQDHLTMISQLGQHFSQIIESAGSLYTAQLITERAYQEAGKLSLQQTLELLKQTDSLNSQLAQMAFDQAQKVLQAEMAVVSANTRA